jgi:UDP-N-acetylmuramyl pentapeptide phosphotransferase/UDP-N-acetylglucosamine-1-phosphate transferase
MTSGGAVAVSLLAALVAGLLLAPVAARVAPGRLRMENWAGRAVPASLGWALVGGGAIGVAAAALWTGPVGRGTVLGGVAAIALFAAGLLDDAFGHRARGLRGHVGSLLRGRPTTGIVKLLVGTAVGIALAVWLGGGAIRVIAASVVIVLSINLWNVLDVVPGRALKWGIVVLAAILPVALERPAAALLAAGLGAALGVLPFDLRERGMLGDAGSNPLGLLAGLGLAVTLPTSWLVVAAAAAVVLQVVAETVTISRVVEAVPPLRWFDRLGRRT